MPYRLERALVLPALVFFVTQCTSEAVNPTPRVDDVPPVEPAPTTCDVTADAHLDPKATLTISAPKNGEFFTAGERPQITVRITDRCDRPIELDGLGIANLYLYGPRAPTLTKTASKLLNCVTDRAASDYQHHYINLQDPRFAENGKSTLSVADDGTITYALAEVSDEPAGTYTAGVWAVVQDMKRQVFALADLQLGTATPEEYVSGPAEESTCAACHSSPSGRFVMHHSHASDYAPFGNPALDSAPVASCKSCHNLDGYSPNPIVRKIHGVHRGEHLADAGVAHPEYGLEADHSLTEYTNVAFPAMPEHEKDCAKCHQDDRWKTAPSRLACGTCHDNVFFDKGTLTPPRPLGVPSAGPCLADSDCEALGPFAACDAQSGACERKTHPPQENDASCKSCHTADESGVAPIAAAHAILSRTAVRGLKITDVEMSGGTGPKGAFVAGDTPTLAFRLVDGEGAAVTDLGKNASLSGTLVIAGPTDDRQRIAGPIPILSQGSLSAKGDGAYEYVLPSPLPAEALSPLNAEDPLGRTNPAGTYTLWLFLSESLTVKGRSVRDAANAVLDFNFGGDEPIRPREVITNAACTSCHVELHAHGGSRRVPEQCSLCHTQGASDRRAGALGVPCTSDLDCPGAAAGWESCADTDADNAVDTCVVMEDPTPDRTIEFPILIHNIHFARRREGYAERNNLVAPGHLTVLGYRNSLIDLSEILFPLDVRSCKKCHADSSAECSAAAPCGIGQECLAGRCENRSFTQPSARICLSCHDSAAAYGHAAINTFNDETSSPIETCDVCHGQTGEFAVERVHDVTIPYALPHPRHGLE